MVGSYTVTSRGASGISKTGHFACQAVKIGADRVKPPAGCLRARLQVGITSITMASYVTPLSISSGHCEAGLGCRRRA
jgi:hypothetical protein